MSEPTFTADQLRQCAEDYREQIPRSRVDEELVAMLEFAARLVERTTWQPMETAPEGQPLLLWTLAWSRPEIGWWITPLERHRNEQFTHLWTIRGGTMLNSHDDKPTHWMPLPEEPRP